MTITKWRTQPRSPLPPSVKTAAEGLGLNVAEAMKLAGIVPASGEPNVQEPTQEPREEVETASSEARTALDDVVAKLRADPELAIVVAELLARAQGGAPPRERASPGETGDPGYRTKPGDVA